MTTLRTADDVALLMESVEAAWGREMQGELGLDDDPELVALIYHMAAYIEGHRASLNAGAPLHSHVLRVLEVLLDPELNGA